MKNIKEISRLLFQVPLSLDNHYDVLVEFYSQRCKRCQALAPIYAAAAAKLASTSNLVIAKIDGTTNEIQGVELYGFPALLYFLRNNKGSYRTYKGDFSEKFVKTQRDPKMQVDLEIEYRNCIRDTQ